MDEIQDDEGPTLGEHEVVSEGEGPTLGESEEDDTLGDDEIAGDDDLEIVQASQEDLGQASVTAERINDEIVTAESEPVKDNATPSKTQEIAEAPDSESKIKEIVKELNEAPEQVNEGYDTDTVYYSPTKDDDVEGSRAFLIQIATRIRNFRYKNDKAKQADVESFLEAWKDNNSLTWYRKFKRNEGMQVEALAKELAAPKIKNVTFEDLQENEEIYLGTLKKRQSKLEMDIVQVDMTMALLEKETEETAAQQVLVLNELSKSHEDKIALLRQAKKQATEAYINGKQDFKEALTKMESDFNIKMEEFVPRHQNFVLDRIKLQNQLDDCTRKVNQLRAPAITPTSKDSSNASKMPDTIKGDASSKILDPSKGDSRGSSSSSNSSGQRTSSSSSSSGQRTTSSSSSSSNSSGKSWSQMVNSNKDAPASKPTHHRCPG